jgi:hypothetical protein
VLANNQKTTIMKTNNVKLVSQVCNKTRLNSLIDWVQYVDDTPLHMNNIMLTYDMFEYNEQLN